MRALAKAFSRLLALRRGLTAAVTLAAASPARGTTAVQGEVMTASGGINLKLMPDVEGAPTIPLCEGPS